MQRKVFTFQPRWSNILKVDIFGGIAQLGEHLLCKQEVIGSIPFASIGRKAKFVR